MSTMEAAARAASVAPETAMPQSAFLSAGASLTPSPVMATMWPRCCKTSTMWNLCSGNTCAKPSASSMDLASAAVALFFKSPSPAASRMPVPIPSVLAVSWAMAMASPVTILTLTPIRSAVAIVTLASFRGGSNKDNTPRNCQAPLPSVRATPNERNPRLANPPTAASTAGFTFRALPDSARITWGAPLVTLNSGPPSVLTVASVRLPTGSKGAK